jgi:hypothetical protein
VVGAVVAFAAVTLMGMLAGSAAASTPGSCTENVNVRAEPVAGSRIVALCEAGTDVTTGAVRNGFVRIENLGGWAAEQYIAVDGAAPRSTPRTAPSSSSDDATTTAPSTTAPRSGSGSGSGQQSDSTSRTGDDAGTTGDSTSQGGTSSNSGDDADEDDDSSGVGGGLLG